MKLKKVEKDKLYEYISKMVEKGAEKPKVKLQNGERVIVSTYEKGNGDYYEYSLILNSNLDIVNDDDDITEIVGPKGYDKMVGLCEFIDGCYRTINEKRFKNIKSYIKNYPYYDLL